jgi:NAD(P)-dependent dehydrogenase (short-subunit alcohol dehydrogenase family)
VVPTDFPSFDLTGKVALVTGAARGLGRAISLALANAGADVALGFRDLTAPAGLPTEIIAQGRRALPLQMDVNRLDQIFKAVDDTVLHFGRLDILVNNAGVAPDNLAEKRSRAGLRPHARRESEGDIFCHACREGPQCFP